MLTFSTGLKNLQAGMGMNGFNLASNGLFTSDLTGWTAGGGAAIAWSAGTMRVTDGGGGGGWVDNDAAITVRKGQIYLCQLDLQASAATPSVTVYVRDTTNGGGTAYAKQTFVTSVTNTTYELFFRVPDGASVTDLFIQVMVDTAAAVVYVDNLGLVRYSNSLRETFRNSVIEMRTGLPPSSANDVPPGDLLLTLYRDGASLGLNFDEPVAGVISRKATETWSGTVVASGTAGWFRLKNIADNGLTNTVDARIDGSVGVTGGTEDLTMATNVLTIGEVQTISTFRLTYYE